MSKGNSRARALVATLALATMPAIGACGSGDEPSEPAEASLSSATAEELALESERIAAELDAGDSCAAAHRADDLDAAVAEADLPEDLRAEVEGATQQLVDQVNCEEPEPTITEETTTEQTTTEQTTTKEEEEKRKSVDGEQREEEGRGDEKSNPSEGGLPPGQEKKISGAGVSEG
jgi:hypothetical protein